MKQIQAKMKCQSVESDANYGFEVVCLLAVYTEDPDSPNYSYSQGTPSAELNMTITNPQAIGAFQQGHEYLVNFTEA